MPGEKKKVLFYNFMTLLMRLALILLTRWEVRGRENVPSQGSFIVVSNHLHLIDPPLLSASIPRVINFMAKIELYKSPLSRWPISAFGAFPVRRGGPDPRALRYALAALAQGRVLGIFPEGSRSPTGKVQHAYPGAALIAMKSAAPVLPVGIAGSEKVRGLLSLLRRPAITVNIGKPFSLDGHGHGHRNSSHLESQAGCIMEHVVELLPQGYRPVQSKE